MGKGKRNRRRKLGPKPVYPPGVAESLGILSVTRYEALIRLIDTAISLWISDKDPLSVHLLVKSCYQCLRDLGSKNGKGPIAHLAVGDDLKFNLVYDWLRHSSGSVTEGVDFAPATNGTLLFEAIESFQTIYNKRTVYMRAFSAYFAFEFAKSFPAFRELANNEVPKGVTANDFATLSKKAFFDKTVGALMAAMR